MKIELFWPFIVYIYLDIIFISFIATIGYRSYGNFAEHTFKQVVI